MAIKTRLAERTEKVAPVKKAAAKKAAKTVTPKKDFIFFVSAEEEVMQFPITVAGEKINAAWDADREHLVWKVPAALADRFAMHEFVVKGRIIRED